MSSRPVVGRGRGGAAGRWGCYVVAVAAAVTAFAVIAVLETRRKEVLARKDA